MYKKMKMRKNFFFCLTSKEEQFVAFGEPSSIGGRTRDPYNEVDFHDKC